LHMNQPLMISDCFGGRKECLSCCLLCLLSSGHSTVALKLIDPQLSTVRWSDRWSNRFLMMKMIDKWAIDRPPILLPFFLSAFPTLKQTQS
jgi:hypothetical protein